MSKFIKDVKGFFNFLNELRKKRPWVFYTFALGLLASIGAGLVAALAYGFVPGMAILFSLAILLMCPALAMLMNVLIKDYRTTDSELTNFITQLDSDHPVLEWSIVALAALAIVAGCLVAFVPGINALVMGSAVAGALGFSAMTSSNVISLIVFGGVMAAIPGGLIIQGLVDILQDIGSCLGCGHASRKASQADSSDELLAYYYMPEKEPHPATAHSYSNPVVGAGGKPTAAVTASSASGQAPTFAKK